MVEPNSALFVDMDGGQFFLKSRVVSEINKLPRGDLSEFCVCLDKLVASMFASAQHIDDVTERCRYTIQQLQVMMGNIEKLKSSNDRT